MQVLVVNFIVLRLLSSTEEDILLCRVCIRHGSVWGGGGKRDGRGVHVAPFNQRLKVMFWCHRHVLGCGIQIFNCAVTFKVTCAVHKLPPIYYSQFFLSFTSNRVAKPHGKIIKCFLAVEWRFQICRSLHQGSQIRLIQSMAERQKLFSIIKLTKGEQTLREVMTHLNGM